MSKYKLDGVDQEAEDDFSAYLKDLCAKTYESSPFLHVKDLSQGSFRGPLAYEYKNLPPKTLHTLEADGVGTKPVLVDAIGAHGNSLRDLLAMAISDITRHGGKPVAISTVLDVAKLGEPASATNEAYRRMVSEIPNIAKKIEIVFLSGETAELNQLVSSENTGAATKYNWSGTALGIYDQDKLITGETLYPGQKVIALKEDGFRSNGISSVRKAFQLRFGSEWWNHSPQDLIQAAATPSVIYEPLLYDALGWTGDSSTTFNIHHLAHITGGGIPDKFFRDALEPRGLSAKLDTLFDPPEIMKYCAEWRNMSSKEFYETFNGGQGYLIVLDPDDVARFQQLAEQYNYESKQVGEIIRGELHPHLDINSPYLQENIIYS